MAHEIRRWRFFHVRDCQTSQEIFLGSHDYHSGCIRFLNLLLWQANFNQLILQFFFKQSPTNIDIIQKTFNLTDEEKFLLLESEVGEGLFFAGSKHVAIKVIASYTEDQIITSDPAQLLQIEQAKKELEHAEAMAP